jgi:hypothetical protein
LIGTVDLQNSTCIVWLVIYMLYQPAAEPLPLLFAAGKALPSAGGLPDPFPPFGVELASGDKGFVVGCGALAAGSVD